MLYRQYAVSGRDTLHPHWPVGEGSSRCILFPAMPIYPISPVSEIGAGFQEGVDHDIACEEDPVFRHSRFSQIIIGQLRGGKKINR